MRRGGLGSPENENEWGGGGKAPLRALKKKRSQGVQDIEKAMIDAFNGATRQGRSTAECYRAAVAVWSAHHPDQVPDYAAQCAVRVILRARVSGLLRAYAKEQHQSVPVKKVAGDAPVGRGRAFGTDAELFVLDDFRLRAEG
jgi:hypothetical protein